MFFETVSNGFLSGAFANFLTINLCLRQLKAQRSAIAGLALFLHRSVSNSNGYT